MEYELTGIDVDQLPIPRGGLWRRVNDYEWRQVAKGQCMKLANWLDQECVEHCNAVGALDGEDQFPRRFDCRDCMQALFKAHREV